MLGLQWRLIFWLAVTAGLAYGISLILGIDGVSRITAAGYEIEMKTGVFIISLMTLLALAMLVFWIALKGVSGVLGVFSLFAKRREKKGLGALSTALVALAEGDGPRALKSALKAEDLLDNPDLTRLVTAQAAKAAGDEERAARYYEMMASDRDTNFIGVAGLLRQALHDNQPERALKLAEQAHKLRPREGEVMDALFDLQLGRGDWSGARETVRSGVKAKRLTRDVGDRRRAVLHVTEAMERDKAGEAEAAHAQAMEAVRLAPSLAPAAALAARLKAARGEARGAARILAAAWKAAPHPDIAAAFAALEPDETPKARQRRFEKLISANPGAEESRLLEAEIALAAEDFEGARTALGDLAETAPSARACALMAALEQATGADFETVRAWLAKAAAAPRNARWVCDSCGAESESWSFRCGHCHAFDSLGWRVADASEGLSESALFPLLAGAAAATPGPALGPTASAQISAPAASTSPQGAASGGALAGPAPSRAARATNGASRPPVDAAAPIDAPAAPERAVVIDAQDPPPQAHQPAPQAASAAAASAHRAGTAGVAPGSAPKPGGVPGPRNLVAPPPSAPAPFAPPPSAPPAPTTPRSRPHSEAAAVFEAPQTAPHVDEPAPKRPTPTYTLPTTAPLQKRGVRPGASIAPAAPAEQRAGAANGAAAGPAAIPAAELEHDGSPTKRLPAPGRETRRDSRAAPDATAPLDAGAQGD
ncbi:MAG: heme biosynthesis HemY N-terminal domain-containing protein [Pseudomonadota bacterium]